MGRKGVSKRKKAKVKVAPVSGSVSDALSRRIDKQPEQVVSKEKALFQDNREKGKSSSKDKKKH